MFTEFLDYFVAFTDKWLFWIGVALLVGDILERCWPSLKARIEKKIPYWTFGLLAIICFVLASFQVWHEERIKSKEGAVYLKVADIAPQERPTNPDIFPVGKPMHVNVAWSVFGTKPALSVIQGGKVYLGDDHSYETQQKLTKDFQIQWEEYIQPQLKTEHTSLFPGDKSEVAFLTYEGKAISEQEKLDIKFGRKFVFIIGAVRFRDATGAHEAHLCRWMEATIDGDYGVAAWHECGVWVTQIDISE